MFFFFIWKSLESNWHFPSPLRNNVSTELLTSVGWYHPTNDMTQIINDKIFENNLTVHSVCSEFYLAYLSYETGCGRWFFDKKRFDIDNFTDRFCNQNQICENYLITNYSMRSFHHKLEPNSTFNTVYRYYSLFHSYFIVYCLSENHICGNILGN